MNLTKELLEQAWQAGKEYGLDCYYGNKEDMIENEFEKWYKTKQLLIQRVSQCNELVCELGKETDNCGNFAINGLSCDGCNHFKQTCG